MKGRDNILRNISLNHFYLGSQTCIPDLLRWNSSVHLNPRDRPGDPRNVPGAWRLQVRFKFYCKNHSPGPLTGNRFNTCNSASGHGKWVLPPSFCFFLVYWPVLDLFISRSLYVTLALTQVTHCLTDFVTSNQLHSSYSISCCRSISISSMKR